MMHPYGLSSSASNPHHKIDLIALSYSRMVHYTATTSIQMSHVCCLLYPSISDRLYFTTFQLLVTSACPADTTGFAVASIGQVSYALSEDTLGRVRNVSSAKHCQCFLLGAFNHSTFLLNPSFASA